MYIIPDALTFSVSSRCCELLLYVCRTKKFDWSVACHKAFNNSHYYIPPPLTVHFSMTRSVRYQPILHTLYYTLQTEHAYCLSYRFFNNVVLATVIEMVELVEIFDGRLGKRSVERVRYVLNNLLHLVIVKYGDISLVLCISTRLRLVTILSLLMKYLVIFHADPCNKSYLFHSNIPWLQCGHFDSPIPFVYLLGRTYIRGWKGKIEKCFWGKKYSCHNWGLNLLLAKQH